MACHATPVALRYYTFEKVREHLALASIPAKSIFPLLHSSNLLSRPRASWQDFQGRKPFDDDHPLPVVGTRLAEATFHHRFTTWEKFLNPQLIAGYSDIHATPEYVGPRTGHLTPVRGWIPVGSSWKFTRNYRKKVGSGTPYWQGQWAEQNTTPRWLKAPRVCPGGPRRRYEGKLSHNLIRLAKVLWMIDCGKLNRNEVITLYQLVEAGAVAPFEIMWPGMKLAHGNVDRVPYPIHLELQAATPQAIKLIEEAGGSFTCTYLSPDAVYYQTKPEEYPSFLEDRLPPQMVMDRLATSPSSRGYLTQWYEEEGKYAHPEAGRRLSHYVRPPFPRDFPATFDEYERVKHHQKWHLQQPGSGTVLPWHTFDTHDVAKAEAKKL